MLPYCCFLFIIITPSATPFSRLFSHPRQYPSRWSILGARAGQGHEVESAIHEATVLKDWPHALQLYDEDGFGDIGCTKAVLSAVGRLGEWQRVLELLDELRMAKAADSKAFTDAALACSASGQSEAVVSLVPQGDADGIVFSRRFWGLATHAYVKLASGKTSAGEAKHAVWRGAVRGVYMWQTTDDPANGEETKPANEIRLLTSVLACCANACSVDNRDDSKGPFRSAMSLVAELCAPKGKIIPDTALANALLKACGRVGDWQFALCILERMLDPKKTVNNVIDGSVTKSGERSPSSLEKRVLESMTMRPNRRTWNTVLSACSQAHQLEKCAWLVDNMPHVDVYTANILMTTLSKSGVVAPVFSILSSLSGESPTATVAAEALTGNTIVVPSGVRGIQLVLDRRLNDFKRIYPDATTYNIAIGAAAQHYRVAIALLREMSNLDQMSSSNIVKPNVVSFSNAILACAKGQQWNLAIDLFNSMSKFQIRPNTICLNAALNACAEDGQVRTAMQLLSKAELAFGVRPDLVTFNTLLNVVANSAALPLGKSHWQVANELLERMIALKIKPDVTTFGSAILSCRRGSPEDCLKAFDFLDAMSSHGVAPNSYSLGATISCLGRAGEWQRALELLDRMKQDYGVAPDTIVCNAALSALERSGQWQASRDLLRDMKKGKRGFSKNCTPDLTSYASVVSAHARAGEWEGALEFSRQAGSSSNNAGGSRSADVQHFVDERWKRGVEAIGYTAAIKACKSDWQKALAVLTEMQNAGVRPDRVAFNAAIAACAEGGQWERALELMEEMHAAWVVVASNSLRYFFSTESTSTTTTKSLALSGAFDVVTFNSAMDACVKGGAPGGAVALFLHMCSGGGATNDATLKWKALRSATSGVRIPTFPSVTGVRPDVLSFCILIEALDGGNDHVVQEKSKSSHRAAYAFANGIEQGFFQPFSYQSYSAILASEDQSLVSDLGLWIPSRLGLIDLHGLSVASARAAVRYALTLIGAHAIVELGECVGQRGEDIYAHDVSVERVETVVTGVVGRQGLTIVTGHGKNREGGEAAAALPNRIRALCKEGIISKSAESAVEKRSRRKRSSYHESNFIDPSPWHHPLTVHEISGNDGAFVVPLSDLTAVAIGCIYEWHAHRKRDSSVIPIDPKPDAFGVAIELLRSRALWEADTSV